MSGGGGGSEDEGIAAFAGEDVAAVGSGAPVAGDIPAAPAFGEGGLVIDDLRAVAQERVTGGVDEERADEEPGNFAHEGPAVAAQAVLIADDRGRGGAGAGQRERVEDGSELRIDRDDLDEAAGHPADVDGVGEIKCAGMIGPDARALKTRAGEDKGLAGGRDPEFAENRAELIEFGAGKFEVADGEAGLETRDGVVGRRCGVADGSALVVGLALGAGGRGQKCGDSEEEGKAKRVHGRARKSGPRNPRNTQKKGTEGSEKNRSCPRITRMGAKGGGTSETA